MRFSYCIVFLVLFPIVLQAIDEKLVMECTTDKKADYHVVFIEIIKSAEQKNWVNAYNAKVDLYFKDKLVKTFKGSTLPNFLPGKNKPKDWQYSVVKSNHAFPTTLKGRYYKSERGKRADKKSLCLRLNYKVPTLNISSERLLEKKIVEEKSKKQSSAFDIIMEELQENTSMEKYQYAVNILVHSGSSAEWRGSAGCLTIDPKDADDFFKKIPEGASVTIDLIRGLESKENAMSIYY
ncbi:MAG: hypothetical protein HUU50_07750 [Candidatus Brocadiae bacterium]|nr:hypothetical protein [Candidatus Brocadiia bacterium]